MYSKNKKDKIFIAEVDEEFLGKLCEVFNKDQFDVTTFINGTDVVEKTMKMLPDFIILGTITSGMSGEQVCRLLKNDFLTLTIPVIMIVDERKRNYRFLMGSTPEHTVFLGCDPDEILKNVNEKLSEKESNNVYISTEIQESKLDNDIDIISKLNNLLDKKCFEADLFNDLTSLVQNIFSYDDLALAVMDIFSKVVDYSVAVTAIVTDEESVLTIHLHKEISYKTFLKIKGIALKVLKKEVNGFEVSKLIVKVISEERALSNIKLLSKNEDTILYNLFLNSGILRKGFLIFGEPDNSLDTKNQELLKTIINDSCIILENSWLYSKLYKNIKNISITDGLTGIYNHKYIMSVIKQEFGRAKRYKHKISIIMFDIDHFKKVNDTFGHQTGDVVLREISSIIQEAVRKSDIVGRYGGEEFAIVLTETDKEKAMIFAERLRKRVENYNFFNPTDPLKITASMGIVSYPTEDIKDPNNFIKCADEALYTAKASGRNRVCVYKNNGSPN